MASPARAVITKLVELALLYNSNADLILHFSEIGLQQGFLLKKQLPLNHHCHRLN